MLTKKNNILKKPFCLQRIQMQDTPVANPTFDQLLKLEYMGFAEFENGALPASLKEFCKKVSRKLKFLTLFTVPNYERLPLVIIVPDIEIAEHLEQYAVDLLEDNLYLKDVSYLKYQKVQEDKEVQGDEAVQKRLEEKSDNLLKYYRKTIAWWDIENHAIFCFGEERACLICKAIIATRNQKMMEAKSEDIAVANRADGWF